MTHGSTFEDILSPLGYQLEYITREKYPGSAVERLCIASRGSVKHYAFRISAPDHPDHHRRIQSIADSTPRVAAIVGPFEDIVLSVEAKGQNLWSMATPPDPATVEGQLLEFAGWTEAHNLIHGDLRPWNVFFDDHFGVQVIDWRNLSAFVDDLLPRDGVPPRRIDLLGEGHYAKFHPDLVALAKFTEIDRRDAMLIAKLLRGEIGIREAWLGPHPTWFPDWCRR
jgi:hypothetical protein